MEKNAGWDIVQIIGKYFNQLVRERIAASPFFGLMVDGTTDILLNSLSISSIW